MSNYLEEQLIKLIENNKLKVLPDTKLIQENERIALAVWKNYREDYDFDETYFDSWYRTGNFGENLSTYKDNINFWKEALLNQDIAYPFDILKNTLFKADFPEVSNTLLKDQEFISKLIPTINYYSTLTDLIENAGYTQNEKDSIYKNYILKDPHNANNYEIKKYENDKQFVETLLTKEPHLYTILSEENKLNDEYIQLALTNKNMYQYLPESKKDEYFSVWAEARNPYLTAQEVRGLDDKKAKELLVNRPDLLESFYTKEPIKYVETVVKAIEKDFSKAFYAFNNLQLIQVFQNPDNLERIRPSLEEFIENYRGTQQIGKKENRAISVIALDKDLQHKLLDNVYYKFNDMPGNKKLALDDFNHIVSVLKEDIKDKKIATEKAIGFLNRVKNKLSAEDTVNLGLEENHVATLLNASTPPKFKR